MTKRYVVLNPFHLGGDRGEVYAGQEFDLESEDAAPHVASGHLKLRVDDTAEPPVRAGRGRG